MPIAVSPKMLPNKTPGAPQTLSLQDNLGNWAVSLVADSQPYLTPLPIPKAEFTTTPAKNKNGLTSNADPI
jgi:hypothetical protein